MSNTTSELAYCATELQDVIQCANTNAAACGPCLPSAGLDTSFPGKVEIAFRQTLAFIPPSQQGFCDEANARICAFHDESLNCCCESETLAFIQCAFDNVYVTKYGVLEACSNQCAGGGDGAGGGGGGALDSMTLMIIIGGGVLGLAFAFCAFMYYRRRGRATEKEDDNTEKASPKPDRRRDDDGTASTERPTRKQETSMKRDVEMGYLSEEEIETNIRIAEREAKLRRLERQLSSEKLGRIEDDEKETKVKLKKANRMKKKVKAALAEKEAEQRVMSDAMIELMEERDELAYQVAQLLEEEQYGFNDEPNPRFDNYMIATRLKTTGEAFDEASEVSSCSDSVPAGGASHVSYGRNQSTRYDNEVPVRGRSRSAERMPFRGLERSMSAERLMPSGIRGRGLDPLPSRTFHSNDRWDQQSLHSAHSMVDTTHRSRSKERDLIDISHRSRSKERELIEHARSRSKERDLIEISHRSRSKERALIEHARSRSKERALIEHVRSRSKERVLLEHTKRATSKERGLSEHALRSLSKERGLIEIIERSRSKDPDLYDDESFATSRASTISKKKKKKKKGSKSKENSKGRKKKATSSLHSLSSRDESPESVDLSRSSSEAKRSRAATSMKLLQSNRAIPERTLARSMSESKFAKRGGDPERGVRRTTTGEQNYHYR